MIEKLIKIQSELKVTKGQYNSFGGYKYRSAEDILEAVKPLLCKQNLAIVITDELVNLNERHYVQATVRLIDTNKNEITTSAYAREEETKKGMDQSQITGSASSYARKYALNGMFAIDDTKDSDFTNKHGKDELKEEPKAKKATQKQIDNLKELLSPEELLKVQKFYFEKGIKKLEDIDANIIQQLIDKKNA